NNLARVELASINQVNEDITGASNVLKSWGHDSENRKAVMNQAEEYVKNNKDANIELLTLISGSTQVKIAINLDLIIDIMEEAIEKIKNNKYVIMELLALEYDITQDKAGLELDLTIGIMEETVNLVDKIGKYDEKESMIPDKMNEYY